MSIKSNKWRIDPDEYVRIYPNLNFEQRELIRGVHEDIARSGLTDRDLIKIALS